MCSIFSVFLTFESSFLFPPIYKSPISDFFCYSIVLPKIETKNLIDSSTISSTTFYVFNTAIKTTKSSDKIYIASLLFPLNSHTPRPLNIYQSVHLLGRWNITVNYSLWIPKIYNKYFTFFFLLIKFFLLQTMKKKKTGNVRLYVMHDPNKLQKKQQKIFNSSFQRIIISSLWLNPLLFIPH